MTTNNNSENYFAKTARGLLYLLINAVANIVAHTSVIQALRKHRNRSKHLPNLKVAILAVPYPFPSVCE